MHPKPQASQADSLQLARGLLGGDAATVLNRLRKRLLDLTGKNRLLHFPHRPGTCLRIVDELPDVIFERLINGRKFLLKPVPEPRPTDYPPTGSKPPAEVHAAKLGLSTSFDLPGPTSEGIAKTSHYDNHLQTLLYWQDLDRLTRRLANAARTSIEESGTNMLYLVLGFLEWVEEQPGGQSRYAPLVTVPVSLTRLRPKKGGVITACLEYSGEDIAVNLCIIEKLRHDFAIELPEFAEDDSPEEYFAKVQRVIGRRPGWRLRRWATICLLYFGKLLMYLDLDSSRWPENKNIQDHVIVRELISGTESDRPVVYEKANIDHEDVNRELPPIIFDADSSQCTTILVYCVINRN